jgi:hypothetical protein
MTSRTARGPRLAWLWMGVLLALAGCNGGGSSAPEQGAGVCATGAYQVSGGTFHAGH